MLHIHEPPQKETFEVDGHVFTIGCVFLPTMLRWEPTVVVRASSTGHRQVQLAVKVHEFRETPEAALEVATGIARAWARHQAGVSEARRPAA